MNGYILNDWPSKAEITMADEKTRSNLVGHFRIEFGASFSDLREGETKIVTTTRREARRFAGYLLPVWLVCKEDRCIISVSPELRSKVKSSFVGLATEDMFSEEGLSRATSLADCINGFIWNQGPYFYNNPQTFKPCRLYEVSELKECDKDVFIKYKDWFGSYDDYWNEWKHNTRVFTIFKSGIPVSTSYTMTNSKHAWEYAVWTREEYRRKGYGKSVVSAAVKETLKCEKLPLYSTSWDNIVSIRLAESLGFQFYCESYAIKIPPENIPVQPNRPEIEW